MTRLAKFRRLFDKPARSAIEPRLSVFANQGLSVTQIHHVMNCVPRIAQSLMQKWEQDGLDGFDAQVAGRNQQKLSLKHRGVRMELAEASPLDLNLLFAKRSLTRMSTLAKCCRVIPVGKDWVLHALPYERLSFKKLLDRLARRHTGAYHGHARQVSKLNDTPPKGSPVFFMSEVEAFGAKFHWRSFWGE